MGSAFRRTGEVRLKPDPAYYEIHLRWGAGAMHGWPDPPGARPAARRMALDSAC